MAIKQKIWTYNDYYNLSDDKRYEVIEGELIEMPAPNIEHQDISGNLEFMIRDYVKRNKLGKVYDAPTDVKLDDMNVVQPDLLFISNENKGIIKDNYIEGSPDVVIEILSPSNRDHDMVTKFALYEKFCVKEYWIIDPDQKSIEIFSLDNVKLQSVCKVSEDEKVKSESFVGLELRFNDLVE